MSEEFFDITELRRQNRVERDYYRKYSKTRLALLGILVRDNPGISEDVLFGILKEYLHRLLIAQFVSIKRFGVSLVDSELELSKIIALSEGAPSLRADWSPDSTLFTEEFKNTAKIILDFEYGDIDERVFGTIFENDLK